MKNGTQPRVSTHAVDSHADTTHTEAQTSKREKKMHIEVLLKQKHTHSEKPTNIKDAHESIQKSVPTQGKQHAH